MNELTHSILAAFLLLLFIYAMTRLVKYAEHIGERLIALEKRVAAMPQISYTNEKVVPMADETTPGFTSSGVALYPDWPSDEQVRDAPETDSESGG